MLSPRGITASRLLFAAALLVAGAIVGERIADWHAAERDRELARLQTERAAEEAQKLGYAAQLAEAEKRIRLEGTKGDSLEAALEAAHAKMNALATVAAEARLDTTIIVVAGTEPGQGPDGGLLGIWSAHVATAWLDLTLTGHGGARPNSLGLVATAQITGELVGAVMPDGRLLVTARSTTPGAELEVPALRWSPPKAPKGPSRFKWLSYGILVGAIGWELIR